MRTDVLLHATDTPHVESAVGVLLGMLLFGLVVLVIRLLADGGPGGGRRTQ